MALFEAAGKAGFVDGCCAGTCSMLRLWCVPEFCTLMHGDSAFEGEALWNDGRNFVCENLEDEELAQLYTGLRTLVCTWPTQRLRQLLEFTTALKVLPPREHPKSLMNQPVVLKRVKQEGSSAKARNNVVYRLCGDVGGVQLAGVHERSEASLGLGLGLGITNDWLKLIGTRVCR